MLDFGHAFPEKIHLLFGEDVFGIGASDNFENFVNFVFDTINATSNNFVDDLFENDLVMCVEHGLITTC